MKRDNNLGILLLGNRIFRDQSLMEYLIEFFLVFCSAKTEKPGEEPGKMRFHTSKETEEEMYFLMEPRIGLRRFIFYAQSKVESHSPIDDEAYRAMMKLLLKEDEGEARSEEIALIHDLLYSYAVVTRNRGWYAKALMPICPSLILTDVQGITDRKGMKNWDGTVVDGGFDFDKHNFLARGGQVLYLHLLQGVMELEREKPELRSEMEKLLQNVLQAADDTEFLASFVQRRWQESRNDPEGKGSRLVKKSSMGYITDSYSPRSGKFAEEIYTFLRAEIHPVARIELLDFGMVLSLLRVMHVVAARQLSPDGPEPAWVMDVSGQPGTSNIGRLAAASYRAAYDSFVPAMAKLCPQLRVKGKRGENDQKEGKTQFDFIKESRKNTCDILKELGKQIRLVIPPRGANERFSLSEQLIRYLVLALLSPGQKVTFHTFLEKLYRHFGMVIAPEQFREAVSEGRLELDGNLGDYFATNAAAFQKFMKQCGFLRDISDATSIVENPYREVKLA